MARFLGEPQAAIPVVHITGTNGKGSTAGMISSILHAAGYNVGTITSPHLVDLRERVCLNGVPASQQMFEVALNRVRQAVESTEANPTYFEAISMAGFEIIARAGMDILVLEVGVGGRRDATSIANPEVAVITEIGLDHTRYLGTNLQEIAREKSGIIKPGCDAVFTADDPSMRTFLEKLAENAQAARIENVDPAKGKCLKMTTAGMQVQLTNTFFGQLDVTLRLPGMHQLRNTLAAVSAAECLAGRNWSINSDHVCRGLEAARWPARFQCVRHDPQLIIDGAHNPGGAEALAQTWQAIYPNRHCTLVFGIFADKGKADVVKTLAGLTDHVYLTTPPSERSAPLGELEELFKARNVQTTTVIDPLQAVEQALAATPPDGTVLAAGSIYLAGHLFSHYSQESFRLF